VRAVEDPALVEYLVEHGIGFDTCPTSNVQLGVYPSLTDIPLKQLYAAGARLNVNTDTPAVFDITLTRELRQTQAAFGFDDAAMETIVRNAFDVAFLSPDERAALLT